MTDIPAPLATLRRPRLLVQAARFGLADYRRERDLARLLPGSRPKSSAGVLMRLMDLEERADHARRAGSASYSVGHHIELLIALMSEVKLLASKPKEARRDTGLEIKMAA